MRLGALFGQLRGQEGGLFGQRRISNPSFDFRRGRRGGRLRPVELPAAKLTAAGWSSAALRTAAASPIFPSPCPCRRSRSISGVHAAVFTALIRASRRRGAWLGGAVEGEDSFPLMDGEHLAANRIFFAALTSRS
jgi:hypothetical protein